MLCATSILTRFTPIRRRIGRNTPRERTRRRGERSRAPSRGSSCRLGGEHFLVCLKPLERRRQGFGTDVGQLVVVAARRAAVPVGLFLTFPFRAHEPVTLETPQDRIGRPAGEAGEVDDLEPIAIALRESLEDESGERARTLGLRARKFYVVPSRVPHMSIAGIMPNAPIPSKPLFVVFRLDTRRYTTEPEFNF